MNLKPKVYNYRSKSIRGLPEGGIKERSRMIQWVLVVNRQGKVRLSKWYQHVGAKDRRKVEREVQNKVVNQPSSARRCNFVNVGDELAVFRRYASLYFVVCIDSDENELLVLEQIHFFVQALDLHFHNVCELDLIFNFDKAYQILDEVFMGGEMQETSVRRVVRVVAEQDTIENEESESFMQKWGIPSFW